jgi:hypothetical protein
LRNAYKILVRISRKEEAIWKTYNNDKIDLKEIFFEDVNWIHVAQNMIQWRDLTHTVMNIPQKARDLTI